jgi:hypothetical protein
MIRGRLNTDLFWRTLMFAGLVVLAVMPLWLVFIWFMVRYY